MNKKSYTEFETFNICLKCKNYNHCPLEGMTDFYEEPLKSNMHYCIHYENKEVIIDTII